MRFGFPSFRRRGTALPGVPPTLYPLALSGYTLPENSGPGTIVGSIIGRTAGSDGGVLSVTAGGRFAISGGNVVAGATATDYEAAQSHSITITETLAGATGSPKATVLTINVVNLNDTNPNAFTLADLTNVAVGTFVYATMTVAGLGASDSVTSTVSGDASSRQRKNGGAWTAAAISGVVNGDVIDAGNTSSGAYSTAVNTVLSVGTTSDTFTSTTAAAGGAVLSIVTAPSILGDYTVNEILFAVNGTYNVVPDSYSYQWYLDGVAVPGETADTFRAYDIYTGQVPTVGEVAHKAGYADSPLNMSV